ncbi:unnamed protein product, partial [Prunus brigantina]
MTQTSFSIIPCTSKTFSVNLNGANTPTISRHLIPVFNTVTMIILKPGMPFYSTKLRILVIHGLSISIVNSRAIFPIGFPPGGKNMVLLLIFFHLISRKESSISPASTSLCKKVNSSQNSIFIAKYKVPWILKWSYKVNWESRILSRQFSIKQFSIKWWDKFKAERIMEQVNTEFPQVNAPQRPSTSGTSHSSLPIEGRSKSELKFL